MIEDLTFKNGLVNDFEGIPCLVLEQDENFDQNRRRKILSRHYESLLEWAPYPKARNIAHIYDRLNNDDKNDLNIDSIHRAVAEQLTTSKSEVKSALLIGFVTYERLDNDSDSKYSDDDKFSTFDLIKNYVNSNLLQTEYLEI